MLFLTLKQNVESMLFGKMTSMDKNLHVKQDEWRYTTSKTSARKLAKRQRNKAKRRLSKARLNDELY